MPCGLFSISIRYQPDDEHAMSSGSVVVSFDLWHRSSPGPGMISWFYNGQYLLCSNSHSVVM